MNKNRTRKRHIQRKRNKNKNKTKTKMHAKRKYTKRRQFLSIQVPDSVTTVTLFKKVPEMNNELKNSNQSEGNLITGMRKFLSR